MYGFIFFIPSVVFFAISWLRALKAVSAWLDGSYISAQRSFLIHWPMSAMAILFSLLGAWTTLNPNSLIPPELKMISIIVVIMEAGIGIAFIWFRIFYHRYAVMSIRVEESSCKPSSSTKSQY
jgi:hypothetical protein